MNERKGPQFTPEGWRSVTPRIVVHGTERLVGFIKHVFEATGDYRQDSPSLITIGNSMIMVSDAGVRAPMPAFLYVYVADTHETYRRAVEAGHSNHLRKCPMATVEPWWRTNGVTSGKWRLTRGVAMAPNRTGR